MAPGLALQRPAHALALFSAETNRIFVVVVKCHLVEVARPQAGRNIGHAVVGTVLHLDGAGVCRQRRGGQQAQHTHQHKQQGRHAGEGETDFLHKLKAPFRFGA